MSRQIFHRYLLFYLSVSAILVCGLSRRVPRGASCPSCSQDCPEALTVQLPWYPEQESNLQPRVLQDSPVNSLQNSFHSSLIKGGISQDITYDNNILSSQNSASLGNYKSFSPQEPASENLLFKNSLNKYPKFIDRREIFSQDKSATRYPLARVLPLRQIFKPENIFRNPRNKYSSSSLEDRSFANNIKDKKEPTNKMFIHRADRDTESLNSNNASSSNVIWPQKFSPKTENTFRFRPDPAFRIFDRKRNTIRKSLNPVNQQHNLTYPRKRYNSVDFVLPELKRDSYVHPLKDIWKPTKNDEFSDNWDNKIEYLSQSSNLEQLKQAENNFLEMYPAKEQEITTEDNSKQINKSYVFPQNLDTWKLTDNKESFDNWDYIAYKDSQESAKINQLQEAENNWLQMFPMEKNIKHFENKKDKDKEFAEQENMNEEYFEDEIVQDALEEIEQRRYNPYAFPQNMNWKTTQDKELFDNLDYTHKNLQQTDQLKIYSEENNDKFFQNKGNENIILETQADDDQINPALMLSTHNAYILPQYLNNAKYPVDSLEMQKIPEAKNNILHVNSMEESDESFFVNEDIIQNNAPIQDLLLSKHIFDMDKYSSRIINKENKDNTQVLTRLDPDLLDDIEDLPLEPTESTSIESLAEFSTSEQ
ncbi:Cytoplasmic phosphatidylinositol transfer protein 1 [Camponotus japonicus]